MIPDRATVQMACIKAETVDGIAVAKLKVPSGGRKINGGLAWFEENGDDDRIQVFVTDEDNLLGQGSGFVVAGYTDSVVPTENQGWFIPKKAPYIEIQRLVDFGHLPANMYIKIIGIKSGGVAGVLRVNLHWGK